MMRYLLLLAVAVAAHGQFGAATSVVSGNGAPVAAQCTNANNVGRVWARKDGGAASTTFYICAATGAGTYGWQLNDGAIGGAGNIASGQVLYGTGAGVAGTSSLFAFDGQRMRVGAAAGADGSALIGTSGALGGIWLNTSTGSPGVGNYVLLRDAGQNTVLNTETGSYIGFRINNVDFGRLFPSGNWGLGTTTDDGTNRLQVAGSVAGTVTSAVSNQDGATSLRLATSLVGTAVAGTPGSRITFAQRWANTDAGIIRVGAINGWKTASDGAFGGGIQLLHQPNSNVDMAVTLSTFQTGNVAIGTTTDGNFRLDIAASGSSGTLRVYDQTPTTGATQVIVRAGAGQSTTNLQTWQNNGGTALAWINSGGGAAAQEFFNPLNTFYQNGNNIDVGSGGLYRFSSAASQGATKDLSLSRASAGVLQVGDGGANANGIVSAAGYRMALTTPASATATGTTGTIVWDADYVYVCTATNTWKRAAIATW
jgi:hypothetical protein